MKETNLFEKYGLHRPSITRIILAKLLGFDILPEHIADHPQKLMNDYKQLRGDLTAIGPGDDGGCPSYVGDPNWWRDLFEQFAQQSDQKLLSKYKKLHSQKL